MVRTNFHRANPTLREEQGEGKVSDEGGDELPNAELLKKRRGVAGASASVLGQLVCVGRGPVPTLVLRVCT